MTIEKRPRQSIVATAASRRMRTIVALYFPFCGIVVIAVQQDFIDDVADFFLRGVDQG